jgi:hypothetical protein
MSLPSSPFSGLPPLPRRGRLSPLDRRQHLSLRSGCWWRGHEWSYRMSTERVIIEFRQCQRCDEVEVQVG